MNTKKRGIKNLVSVIVPIYNNSKEEIERCVQSLVNQTYQNLEILLIDDGSDKETIVVEEKLQEQYSKVRVIWQVNAGVSQARNRGLSEACGKQVCFVDADDYVAFDMIEKMLSVMEEECLVSTNFVNNDSDICVLSIERELWKYEFDGAFINTYLNGELGKQIAFSACNKMFDMTVIKETEIRFPVGVSVGEDMIFVLWYLAKCNGIRIVNEGLYHYNIRETSVMNATKKDYLDVYCKTLKAMQEMCFEGLYIPQRVLGNWCLEILTYILNNRYVSDMSYEQFREYYKRLASSTVFEMALRSKKTYNFKRDILRFVLKVRSRLLLFGLIKANQ